MNLRFGHGSEQCGRTEGPRNQNSFPAFTPQNEVFFCFWSTKRDFGKFLSARFLWRFGSLIEGHRCTPHPPFSAANLPHSSCTMPASHSQFLILWIGTHRSPPALVSIPPAPTHGSQCQSWLRVAANILKGQSTVGASGGGGCATHFFAFLLIFSSFPTIRISGEHSKISQLLVAQE